MLALDAYNRRAFESMAKSSKPCECPHSGTDHLVRNFPLCSNICIRLLLDRPHKLCWSSINCNRSRIIKLSVAISFVAPDRQHLSIGTELGNPLVALIDDINRVIRANSYSSWTVEAGLRSFPLCDECSVGGQLFALDDCSVCHVDVAGAVDGDATWCPELSVSAALFPVLRNAPVDENFSIRPLPVSATRTFPLRSTAIPVGELNCPLPVPFPPSNMLVRL